MSTYDRPQSVRELMYSHNVRDGNDAPINFDKKAVSMDTTLSDALEQAQARLAALESTGQADKDELAALKAVVDEAVQKLQALRMPGTMSKKSE